MVYDPRDTSVGGTHAIFLFRGEPEEYNLPSSPEVPTIHLQRAWTSAIVTAGLMAAGALLAFLGEPRRAQRAPGDGDGGSGGAKPHGD